MGRAERRALAAGNLLRAAHDALSGGSVLRTLREALNVSREDTWRQVFELLADYVDPTCEARLMDCAGEPPHNVSGLHLNDTCNGCSACGYPWHGFHGREHPAYCPNCGARVVIGGAE